MNRSCLWGTEPIPTLVHPSRIGSCVSKAFGFSCPSTALNDGCNDGTCNDVGGGAEVSEVVMELELHIRKYSASRADRSSKTLDEVAMAEAPAGKELIPSPDGQGISR